MRTIAIVAATVVPTAALTLYLGHSNPLFGPQQPMEISDQPTQVMQLQNKLDELATVLQRYQAFSQEQLEQNQSQQARIDKKLSSLDSRMRSVETVASRHEQDMNALAWDSASPIDDRLGQTVADEDLVDDTETTQPPKISEGELSLWMDELLSGDHLDESAATLNVQQVEESLLNLPDVYLDDMKCGEGFCRATFASGQDKQPEIGALFGQPPFLSEGFTVDLSDGRVALYFAGPGETLEGFRGEAQQVAEW